MTIFKRRKAGRCTYLLFFLLYVIHGRGQTINLVREVEIEFHGVQPQTGNYYDIALRDTFLNILFHNPENGKAEIWIEKEQGYEKHGIVFPDGIETYALTGAFDINERYFCYADKGNIYIGESKHFGILRRLKNFQDQHCVATNLSLKNDTIIFTSYETLGESDWFKSYAIKYHIPTGRFFDTVFLPIKNTYYPNFNHIEPLVANEHFIAFGEPHEYHLKVVGWRDTDTLHLIREDLKYLWKPVRQDSAEILFTDDIDHLSKTPGDIDRKNDQISYYVFNNSNINKLFFVSDSLLLVKHSHPHAKMSYADLWWIGDSAVLLKSNQTFSERIVFFNEGTASYTFIPYIMSSSAFYAGKGRITMLTTNLFRKDYKKDKLIIQVYEVR